MKAAVIGAGWAGLAASVALREAGAKVTVFEAGHTPGGRARRVFHTDFDAPLDNGQHLLSGAYKHTLALMRRVGRNPDALLMRRPLQLASLDGRFRLAAPRLPAPLHMAAAILRARGLAWKDRLATLRLMRGLKTMSWTPPREWTVLHLLHYHAQSDALIRQVWEPLCLAALNTPTATASAALFARVLRDSLTGSRENSDMLLPCTDLSALWPDAAARQVTMRYGSTVRQLRPSAEGIDINQERFDAAVLAVPPAFAARLLDAPLREAGATGLLDALKAFEYMPIATLNLRLQDPWRLPEPMMMLREESARDHYGQWLFDRAQLAGDTKAGELAVVTSAATGIAERNRRQVIEALIDQVAEQAARHPARLPAMPEVTAAELFIEKRATFAAVPGLTRPLNSTPWPTLALAGDWTDTGYPGVLEGAVRSGLQAARVLNPAAA
ncbi:MULTISPECIES: hydroxysqualene dehydroxylase HpnE [Achromobacter]|uniref:Hydroxysqualene dehydroxylase HpnE n=8 Tax=Alcaligenaceae TaxID=506 RepID=A0AAD2IY43_ACHAE|nr:hydroxysqualene dehydroxylase HpnE [Achromobacter aegrifaciens]MBD9476077.1 FAD-dependent oxidoreductase [Achromobacter sp. ACM01]MDQ1762727.1 hydroxysqualene dehydroxylase HpnE [Achromobacter aegrifaciens]MDR7945085.1 hydroxysqualene dehydroxylase HpnE [Achromobacter aegrifaciens]CAB3659933.1 Hydroxysqualene dehydroxylase [Achromobacter aegrifaciens]CAB3916615.1 Hydroxysqualene dehydroxylase [Achromobacter aegrifaciens]